VKSESIGETLGDDDIRWVDVFSSENAECWLLVLILLLLLAAINDGLAKITIGDDTTINTMINIKSSFSPDKVMEL
jgi:hypothetical protein